MSIMCDTIIMKARYRSTLWIIVYILLGPLWDSKSLVKSSINFKYL